jgi:hypothetical protein
MDWKTCGNGSVAAVLLACILGCPMSDDDASDVGNAADGGGGVAAPWNLACESHQLDVFLSWQNGESYDSIRITRGGTLVAVLDGSAISVSETLGQAGTFTYGVAGVDPDGVASQEATCVVTTGELAGVEGFSCAFESGQDSVEIEWSLPAGVVYQGMRLTRNGQLVADLAAGATAYTDVHPPAGTNGYELIGYFGDTTSDSATCSVAVGAPAEIRNFTGRIDAANGDFLLSWQNGAPYDAIVVMCGGEEIATLDGASTSFRFTHEALGVYGFSLYGTRGDQVTDLACWQGTIGRLVWDEDTTGAVVGYNVYVWPAGDPVPDATEPSFTVASGNAVALSDLLAADALPPCREPASFSLALASLDENGAISELSTPVTFAWQVLCQDSLE